MLTLNPTVRCNCWPLSRVMMLMVAGGFAGLMVDIRVEHVDVVRKNGVAWLPIIYAGATAIACFATFLKWNAMMRLIARVLFVGAIGVGATGFYLHNDGNVVQVARSSLSAWTDRQMHHDDGPPQTAPLAFAGLGVIGILTTLKRFDSTGVEHPLMPKN